MNAGVSFYEGPSLDPWNQRTPGPQTEQPFLPRLVKVDPSKKGGFPVVTPLLGRNSLNVSRRLTSR